MENKRYIVTLDAYIYANNDKEAEKEAKKLAKHLRSIEDNHGSVTEIHKTPWGNIRNTRKIK